MAQKTEIQQIRGMQSLLGEEADRLHAVINAFDRVRRLFGFKRVEVPMMEPTAVFARSLGETTDVVSKEMYTFQDRGGDSVTYARK
jgi:histidyl-tRNA synthetase